MMRLLIVDDNSDMRRLMRSIVKNARHSIFECENGATAVDAYREHRPDWVLMDVDMPVKDGLTATSEICAEFPEARVVIVTKHSDDAMREAAAGAGACGFVVKENLMELLSVLRPDAH